MARFDLRDRLVLVTGAAHGMGLGLARAFASRGSRLVLWDVDGVALSDVADEFLSRGLQVRWDVVDLRSRAAVAEAARGVLDEDGPVDVLVNNAGVVAGKALLDLTDADIERTIGVNALALFWTTRAFLPAMIEQGRGPIVTLASAAGLVGTARLSAYSASKHAAVGFNEALRTELGLLGHPIGTTVVCPFFVDTGMFRGAKTRVPWLLPVLSPDVVVRRTVRAVEHGRRRIVIPRFAYSVYLLRLVPVAWFDRVMDWMGVTSSMKGFSGRGEG